MDVSNVVVAFASQFVFVFLLGLQTANIRDREYKLVFLVSVSIGIAELGVMASVIKTVITTSSSTPVYIAFVFGGAFGVSSALWFSDWLNKRRTRK